MNPDADAPTCTATPDAAARTGHDCRGACTGQGLGPAAHAWQQARRRGLLALGGLGACALWPLGAQAKLSDRPITLLVPFAPGGIADITARTVAEALARQLGQPVVVDNRPGAGAIAATVAVKQAVPDGHTLLLLSNANAVSAALMKQLPYDPQRDLQPVGPIGFFDLGLFSPANGRFATAGEALVFARSQPGRLNIGTIAVGSTQHLAAKLLETQAGIDALVVPYKGTPALLQALRSGEVDLGVEILGPALPQVRAGALRALALATERRHPLLPDAPTAAEAGVKDWHVASWNGLAAPAGTPPAVVETLSRALQTVLAQPAVQQRLAAAGLRLTPVATEGPQALRALLAAEIRRWAAVVKAAKIEPE